MTEAIGNTDQNQRGQLTKPQILFLSTWLIQRIVFFVALPYLMAYLGRESSVHLSTAFAIFGTVMLIFFLWAYGMDIVSPAPLVVSGVVIKRKIQRQGPPHYYLLIDNKQIRAPKDKWLKIKEGSMLTLYYAKRTKWLLSYENLGA